MYINQPKPVLPDLSSGDFVSGWLNKAVAMGKDIGVTGYDMTANGTIIPTANGGGDYDGSTGYHKNSTANWRSSDSAGTITAWIKKGTVNTTDVIFSSADEAATNNRLFLQTTTTAKLQFGVRNTGTFNYVTGDTTLVAGQWYYAVGVSSGTAYSLYLDSVAERLTPTGTNNGDWFADIANRDSFLVGALEDSGGVSNYFDGQIQMVNYYSSPKSQDWLKYDFLRSCPEGA